MFFLNRKFATLLFSLTLLAAGGNAQRQADQEVAKKVENTMKKMTLQEKMDLIGEYKAMSMRPLPRLGIPEVKMSYASLGVCGYGAATQYPASVVGASTWNRRLMYGLGVSLAGDAKARGVHMILGPGVNIMRAPVCGRNFEYMSEDPYLTAEMAVSYIGGMQSRGVGAVVKHFALNNMEWGRATIDSRADERTCHEIYFPAFCASVQRAQVAGVMAACNPVNGDYATENDWLNLQVLRRQWGFDGILMSGSGATHSTVKAANSGLDLDMDGNDAARYFNRDSLAWALKSGLVTAATIDDKVRNILRIIYRMGWDKVQQVDKTVPLDNAQSSQVALREAEEGIVLLKNRGNLLPLKNAGKILVAGPFVDNCPRGGGSSSVTPFHCVSLLTGLKKLMPRTQIMTHEEHDVSICNDLYIDRGGQNPGLKVSYFNNSTLGGMPLYEETVRKLDFNWGEGSPSVEVLGKDYFSARYSGYLRVPKTGDYTLVLISDGGSRMWLDDELVIDNWGTHARGSEEFNVHLQQNRDYRVSFEYSEQGGEASLDFGYRMKGVEALDKQLKGCDAVIMTAGFGEELESEGFDRSWTLPESQVEAIKEVASKNNHVVVVLYAGGAVDVSDWIDDVEGVIFAGYPGQEGGTALAEVITGAVTPSGKLTATWAKRWEDYPSCDNYYEKQGQKHMDYAEKLLVGYRHFDTRSVEPVFPFGFGLSYTKFAYSDLKVTRKRGTCKVTVDVKNTGKCAGAEVVQVYVQPHKVAAGDPVHTLRGFDKLTLKPGQKKSVTITLDENAFSTYKTQLKKFTVNEGSYKIKVGASSRDIRLNTDIQVKNDTGTR